MAKELGQNDMSNNTGAEKPRRGPNLDALEARIRAKVKDERAWVNGFGSNGVVNMSSSNEELTDEELRKRYMELINRAVDDTHFHVEMSGITRWLLEHPENK